MNTRPGTAGNRAVPVYTLLLPLLALLLVLAPALLAAPARAGATPVPAAAPASPTRTDDGIDVEITAMNPAVVRPGEGVNVEVTLTNTAGEDAPELTVTASLQTSVPNSRTTLLAVTEEPATWPPATRGAADLALSLDAGESATRTFELPSEALPEVDATTWGPRGLEIAATDAASGAHGSARTWLVLAPQEVANPLPFTAVVPLTPTAQELGVAQREDDPAGVLRATAGPRIEGLAAALTTPATTFAIDPLLLTPSPEGADAPPAQGGAGDLGEGQDGGTAGTPPPGTQGQVNPTDTADDADAIADATPSDNANPQTSPTPQSTQPTPPPADPLAPATELERILTGAPLPPLLLPEGDADVAALAHAAEPAALEGTVARARERAARAGVPTRSDVLLAPGTVLDAATVEAARGVGLTAVVGSAALAPTLDAVPWTVSARADLPLGDGVTAPALLGDAELARIVAGTLPTGPRVARTGQLDQVEARQLALALTAVVQRERPNDPRTIAIVLDRATAGDPERRDQIAGSLDALAQAPWLTPRSVPDLLAADVEGAPRTALPAREPVSGEFAPARLAGLARQLERVGEFGAATSDPAAILRPQQERFAMTLAHAWREAPTQRARHATDLARLLDTVPEEVRIAPSSTINMLATSAELPVRVTNSLPVAVRAVVRLDPPDGRLTATRDVAVTIPAHGEATALVPVEARGSGNFELRASLATESGIVLGDVATIDVRLRADWEGRGAAIGGAVLAAVVLLGILRTARRHRRARTGPAPEDPPASQGAGAPGSRGSERGEQA